jgi:hypothetical protein
MKLTRSLQIATVAIAFTVAATASIAITAPRQAATIVLPQIVVSAHRPVHQLSAVTVTGKRLHADEKTRMAAVSGVVTAS